MRVGSQTVRRRDLWGVWGICSVVVLSLCVCVWCVVSRCLVCCQRVWRVLEVRHQESRATPLSLHMLEKAWVPWPWAGAVQQQCRNSQVPPAAPGGSQSHLASPACGWVRACLVRLVLPLPARVSVCQSVSDASAETKSLPLPRSRCVGSLALSSSPWLLPTGARFVKPSAPPVCLVRHGESHTACPSLPI